MTDLFNNLASYLRDVFVIKFDAWVVLGFVAQGFFTMRFVVQWIASERAGKSVIPIAFWFFSIGGGALLLVYALYRRDPVFIAGQAFGVFVYARNLYFELRDRRREASTAGWGPVFCTVFLTARGSARDCGNPATHLEQSRAWFVGRLAEVVEM